MMVWVYTFEDDTVLKLIDAGLTTAEICKLQELHHGGAVVIDLIERRAANEKTCSMCRLEGTENCDECEHPIDDIPSAQQWIPVSSGLLPKADHGESEDVLCQLENMRRIVLYFDGSNWCYPSGEPYIGVNYENGWSNKVIAWMPLPKSWNEAR